MSTTAPHRAKPRSSSPPTPRTAPSPGNSAAKRRRWKRPSNSVQKANPCGRLGWAGARLATTLRLRCAVGGRRTHRRPGRCARHAGAAIATCELIASGATVAAGSPCTVPAASRPDSLAQVCTPGGPGTAPGTAHVRSKGMAGRMLKRTGRLALAGLMAAATVASPVAAEQAKTVPNNPNCRNTGSFEAWLDGFRQEARASGVSNATIAAALGGMTLDPGIIQRDRRQGFFAQTFTAFSGKLITPNRIQNGSARLRQHGELLAKIEQQYGVPGPVLVAFWGLESDFGSMMGKLPILRSLATAAYDCRRPELVSGELLEALRRTDGGDRRPEQTGGC